MQRKIIIARGLIVDQSHPLFHKILSGRTTLLDKISLRPIIREYTTINLKEVLDTDDVAIIEIPEENFWSELLYWKAIGNTRNIGILGEKIAASIKEVFIEYLEKRLGLSPILSKYTAQTQLSGIKPDFTFMHEKTPVAFLEVSIGNNLKKTLIQHLFPESNKRFNQENYRLGFILTLEYDVEERQIKAIIAEKEREKNWINITKYILKYYK